MYQRLQIKFSKRKNGIVECRLAHTSKMNIKAISMRHLLICKNCFDFISQFLTRYISVESIFRAITKLAIHRTAFLSADSSDPFIRQINRVMLNAIDFLVQAKKTCFDIVFLAIIANRQKFKLLILINIDFAGMCFYNPHSASPFCF